MAFADAFTFARPTAAPYRDAAGVVQTAAVDQPRFDHDDTGRPLGLLVEVGTALGRGDRARVVAGGWAALASATVLHEWTPAGGETAREAHYATDAAAMVNGCLGSVGWHRRIVVMAGPLRNYGGYVWALEQSWTLPSLIGTGDGAAIGTVDARPLLAT